MAKIAQGKPIVFGTVTPQQAEDFYRFGDVMAIVIPDGPPADFDLPNRPKADRDRYNEIAQRWRDAYIGNYAREDGPHTGDNWLIFDCGDHQITSDHVHASEMIDQDTITEFVINAPDDVKWLLQLVLDILPDEEEAT